VVDILTKGHRDMSDSEFITQAPADLEGWMQCFDAARLPVLAETAVTIEDLRLIEEQRDAREHMAHVSEKVRHRFRLLEDEVDAHLIAETIGSDPLMTLKVLAQVSAMRRPRESSTPETVVAALVLMGIRPFFRSFGPQQSVEDRLRDWPEALAGFRRVLRRSHRAANFAAGFAVHRNDQDAAVIQEAALLHDFTELLLWVHAPALAQDIFNRQKADPQLRSAEAQRAVLNVDLAELQHALMQAWRLPPLLVHIANDQGRVDPQALTARLAIRLARHSADGWNNAALPDDLWEIGALLQLGSEPTRKLIERLDS